MEKKDSAEKAVREIRRKTRRRPCLTISKAGVVEVTEIEPVAGRLWMPTS
jgi:hypothetical protein